MMYAMSPSSRGLGHHPFTVSTGVRIPLGTPKQKCPLMRAFLFWRRQVRCLRTSRGGFEGFRLPAKPRPAEGRRIPGRAAFVSRPAILLKRKIIPRTKSNVSATPKRARPPNGRIQQQPPPLSSQRQPIPPFPANLLPHIPLIAFFFYHQPSSNQ